MKTIRHYISAAYFKAVKPIGIFFGRVFRDTITNSSAYQDLLSQTNRIAGNLTEAEEARDYYKNKAERLASNAEHAESRAIRAETRLQPVINEMNTATAEAEAASQANREYSAKVSSLKSALEQSEKSFAAEKGLASFLKNRLRDLRGELTDIVRALTENDYFEKVSIAVAHHDGEVYFSPGSRRLLGHTLKRKNLSEIGLRLDYPGIQSFRINNKRYLAYVNPSSEGRYVAVILKPTFGRNVERVTRRLADFKLTDKIAKTMALMDTIANPNPGDNPEVEPV